MAAKAADPMVASAAWGLPPPTPNIAAALAAGSAAAVAAGSRLRRDPAVTAGSAPVAAAPGTGDPRPEQAGPVASAATLAATVPALPAVKSMAAMAAVTVVILTFFWVAAVGRAWAALSSTTRALSSLPTAPLPGTRPRAAPADIASMRFQVGPARGWAAEYSTTTARSPLPTAPSPSTRPTAAAASSFSPTAPTSRPRRKSTIPSSARATPPCPTWWPIRSTKVRPRSAATRI